MSGSVKCWMLVVLLVTTVVYQAHGNCFPAVFNFGDNDGDTGGIHASFPNTTAADASPYGETYFGFPQGRNCDGRLIIDFITEAYGLRHLDPYLQSVTSDYSQGANFAVWGSVARTVNYVSPFPLNTQVKQFLLFQKDVLEVFNETSTILASRGILGNTSDVSQDLDFRGQPYKELYEKLFNTVTINDSLNGTTDADIQRTLAAASRLPLPEYFDQGLYLLSIGTNDFKVGIAANQTPDEIVAYLPDVVTAVTTAAQDLYDAGARNIVIAGVGDIGCSPAQLALVNFTLEDLDNWGCLVEYNRIARTYNSLLTEALANLAPQAPFASITYLNTYQIQHNLLFNYTLNGMVDPIKACCGVPSTYNYDPQVICGEQADIANTMRASQTCSDPSEYAVWDGIHYTEAANRYFANQIFSGDFFDPPFPSFTTDCTISPI